MSGASDAKWLPIGFVDRMRQLLGGEVDAFLAALGDPEPGLRLNTLRLSPERWERIAPLALSRLPFPAGGYRYDPAERPGRHPYHAAGVYYLQDPGAMVVAPLMEARPGERVLDLAAAPGGKATQLAAIMEGRGVLVANDVHPTRARELAGNLERLGAAHAVVTSESAARLADRFGPWFDRVLVDAPCSGESMFHKSDAARLHWSDAAVRGCAVRQEELLVEAARLVAPGGSMVYSTCTFAPEENEGVVAAFLDAAPDFHLAELDPVPGAEPARPEWVAGASRPDLRLARRVWPHRVAGAGHFVARFRRDGETGLPPTEPPSRRVVPGREAQALLDDFIAATLADGVVEPDRVDASGEGLVERPDPAPPLDGLRVLVAGRRLGLAARGRFEPHHALAMSLRPDQVRDPVRLESGDPRVAAYLRGETIREPGRAGWVLVAVDGFPLGWGKRTGDVVKNHYPKGLRRR